jgi:hypothetical protein
MTKKYLYIGILMICFSSALHAQKLYFNGLGRALLSNSRLHGNALSNDTSSARKRTTGYFLFDFGINYQPSNNFRTSATIRLRNELGGFYGTANHLSFRQFKIEGILAKSIKIEVGDLDLGLTPYTLYNFDEIYHDYESEIFAIRRRITNYENFNFGNKWRLQGGNISSDIKFSRGIDRIGIRGFLTNTGRTDYFHLPTLQRIIAGGRIDLVQSKFFKVGGNYTGMFDTRNQPTENNFNNHVFTGDYKININIDSLTFSLYGEAGKSTFTNHTAGQKYEQNGKFYEANLSGNIKPWTLNLYGSYRMVDENFTSPGAQTRRIFDNGIPQLFTQTDNNTLIRQPSLLDRYSDESIRNLFIRPTLMAFLPQYNNITPYGIATPNRKGFSFGFNKGNSDKALMADGRVDLLKEVKAEGGAGQRNFTGIKGGFLLNLHKLMKWEKMVSINFGIRKEDTKRNPDSLRLKSTLWDAGINIEIFRKFDLLFGYKLLNAKGNESGIAYSNLRDGIIASGLRYRFSRNTFFTAQGHWVKHLNMNMSDDYKINQLFLNFTMIF